MSSGRNGLSAERCRDGEELLKFVAYAEIKERYGSRTLAVLLPVGFWAGFHALQAYSNVIYVVPAFVCGLILLALLEATKSVIAPIIAHGAYNSLGALSSIMREAPVAIPWFPFTLTSGDIILVGLTVMWIAFILLPPLVRS